MIEPLSSNDAQKIFPFTSDNKNPNAWKNFNETGYDSDKGMGDCDPVICNVKIDQITSKEIKEGNIIYLDYKIVDEMYEMLVYSGDLKFSIHAAEILYSRTKMDDGQFISPYSCYYYAHRRNLNQIDFMEHFYSTYLNLASNNFGMVKIQGHLTKIGYKYKQQVVLFTPVEMQTTSWDFHMIRRGTTVPKEVHSIRENSRLNENEYVMLLTLEDDKTNAKIDTEFNELLQTENGQKSSSSSVYSNKDISLQGIKESSFFQRHVAKGKRISRMVIGLVTDISKEYAVKIYTLPTHEDSQAFNDPKLNWILVRLPIAGYHHASNLALEAFTTKTCSNPVISHIVFSPPLISRSYLVNLCENKANLEIHQSSRIKAQINSIVNNLSSKIDSAQVNAVQFALSRSVSLIHAPNCTGKLATLAQIVSAWLNISTSHILVCTESNLKADMLHLALTSSGINSVRVSTSPDDQEDIKITPGFGDTLYKMQEANTYFNAFYVRYPILKKIISTAPVIVTTLDALVSEYFSACIFPRVIVDDCSSTTESLSLSSLSKGCQHLVIFGDHKTLPPKIYSEFSACKGMRISLFERYVRVLR